MFSHRCPPSKLPDRVARWLVLPFLLCPTACVTLAQTNGNAQVQAQQAPAPTAAAIVAMPTVSTMAIWPAKGSQRKPW